MSNPQNMLGKFRSYAYHHILMVCNNSEAAELLTETSDITEFQHPFGKGRYSTRSIGNDENNKYITLIDGTSDARFFITSATWENVLAMENTVGKGGIPQSTSMSLEGELEIVEPMGASFLNRLTDACDLLSTDPVGLVFVLKTIFVGHNDIDSSEMISNIKPLLFINYDISAVFDSSGAKYKMQFVGAVNGMGKLPHTQKIFNGINIDIPEKENLAKTFARLAELVNERYDAYEKQAINSFAKTLIEDAKQNKKTLTESAAATEANDFYKANYRRVTYEIHAPDYAYPQYIAGDNESVRVATKSEAGSFSFGKDLGVEDIIKKIMASCTGVINDGNNEDDKGKKYIYKIVSGLSSAHNKFVVKYYIKRYELAILPYEYALEGKEYEPSPGQSIEFNYIFTGKNVDIKSFDIKMEMGMAFFQVAATTNSLPDGRSALAEDTQSIQRDKGAISTASKEKEGKPSRKLTPLFLGTTIKKPLARNTKHPAESASFQALLDRHAALENIQAHMTIYGNPQLLSEMQMVPSDLVVGQVENPVKDKTINPRWVSSPTLVKINIKMPVDANDVNTEYEDFWYTGYYSLFAVKQIFSDGVFLQELDMLSIPTGDKISKKVEEKPTSVIQKSVDVLSDTALEFITFGIAPTATYNNALPDADNARVGDKMAAQLAQAKEINKKSFK